MTARQRGLRNALVVPRVRVLGIVDEEGIGCSLRRIPVIRRPEAIWAAGIFTCVDAVVPSRLIQDTAMQRRYPHTWAEGGSIRHICCRWLLIRRQ